MAAAFTEFTKVQQSSVMPFVDFEGVKANEIYDGIVMNGVKHLDASSGWGFVHHVFGLRLLGYRTECHGQPKKKMQKLNIK